MAAGPTLTEVRNARATMTREAKKAVEQAGQRARRCGGSHVEVYDAQTNAYIGVVAPRLIRASNGEAALLATASKGGAQLPGPFYNAEQAVKALLA